MLVIVHSGQTGVERGAHRAAVAAGLRVEGLMPMEQRDELGPIPLDIATFLRPWSERGSRPAVRANIAMAAAAMLVVPDATTPEKFTAMSAVLQCIRSARLPSMICDANTNLDEVGRWARQLSTTTDSLPIAVTGPRATRWPAGESVARRLVSAMEMMGTSAHSTQS